MNRSTEGLDDLAWLEKARVKWKIALVAGCAVALFTLIYFFVRPVSTQQVLGTIVARHGESDERTIRHYLIVRLDSGPTVRVRFEEEAPKVGRRLALTETATRIGYKWYKFDSYLD